MTVSSNPQGPLSVGNVVSAGLRLYSNHFKQYFGTALLATLWIILPFLAIALVIGFFSTAQAYYELLWLIIPAWLVLLFYCLGKYLAGSAAISRLAFGELSDQPETTKNARRFTNSRLWSFVWMSLLLVLLYIGIFVVAYIALILAAMAILFATGAANLLNGVPFEQIAVDNPTLALGLGLGVTLLLLLLMLFFIWLWARLAVPELPLAVETEVGAAGSIGRSWQLTQKSAWRVVLILFVTFLITLPLLILVQIVVGVLQGIFVGVLPDQSSAAASLLLLISYAISFGTNVFMLPLWQAIKAVIYYDLRSRREGLGLQLRDREI